MKMAGSLPTQTVGAALCGRPSCGRPRMGAPTDCKGTGIFIGDTKNHLVRDVRLLFEIFGLALVVLAGRSRNRHALLFLLLDLSKPFEDFQLRLLFGFSPLLLVHLGQKVMTGGFLGR